MDNLTTINMHCEDCGVDVVVFGYLTDDLYIEDFENYDDQIHKTHDMSFMGTS